MSAAESAIPKLTEVIERYRRLESALLYDLLGTSGLPNQRLSLEIQPPHREMVVAGPALTSTAIVSEAAARVRTERT